MNGMDFAGCSLKWFNVKKCNLSQIGITFIYHSKIMKIKSRTIILSTLAATLIHIGVAAIAWRASEPVKTMDLEQLVFVDLSFLQHNESKPSNVLPKVSPTQPEKPKIEKVVQKTIQTVYRKDKPTDLVQPEKPQPKKERLLEKPVTQPEKPLRAEVQPQTSSNQALSKEEKAADLNPAGGQNVGAVAQKGTQQAALRSGENGVIDGGYVHLPMPNYPMSALENGEEGKVLIEVVVEADGRILSAKVKKSSGSMALDKAARLAVKNTKMKPKMVNGSPVRSRFIAPFVFTLKN